MRESRLARHSTDCPVPTESESLRRTRRGLRVQCRLSFAVRLPKSDATSRLVADLGPS
jgi:hypothetical protein